MNWLSIQRIVGLLLMMFSVSMLTPIIITLIYEDGNWSSFLYSFLLTFFAGIITWFPSRNSINDLKLRDGFVVVALFWIVLGSFVPAELGLKFAIPLTFIAIVVQDLKKIDHVIVMITCGLSSLLFFDAPFKSYIIISPVIALFVASLILRLKK